MDKGTKVEQIFYSYQTDEKHGIKPAFFLQFGYPGKTRMTFRLQFQWWNHWCLTISESLSAIHCRDEVFEKGKEELKDNPTGLAQRWACHDVQQYLSLHHSIKCCSDMFTVPTVHDKESRRWKNLFSSPVQISFRQLKRIAAIPVHATGSAYYKSKLEIISGEHGLVGINWIFSKECIWYHVYDAGNWFTFDLLASDYDDTFTHSEIGKLQRGKVWEYLDCFLFHRQTYWNWIVAQEKMHCIWQKRTQCSRYRCFINMIVKAEEKNEESRREEYYIPRERYAGIEETIFRSAFRFYLFQFWWTKLFVGKRTECSIARFVLKKPGGRLVLVMMSRKCVGKFLF